MASLGVWCTLRKQRIWFDSRRVVARVARREAHCEPIDSFIVSARVLWRYPLLIVSNAISLLTIT